MAPDAPPPRAAASPSTAAEGAVTPASPLAGADPDASPGAGPTAASPDAASALTETERPNVLNESTVPRTYAKSNIEMVETQGSMAFFSLDITQYPLRMYSLTLVGMIVRFGSVFSFLTS